MLLLLSSTLKVLTVLKVLTRSVFGVGGASGVLVFLRAGECEVCEVFGECGVVGVGGVPGAGERGREGEEGAPLRTRSLARALRNPSVVGRPQPVSDQSRGVAGGSAQRPPQQPLTSTSKNHLP